MSPTAHEPSAGPKCSASHWSGLSYDRLVDSKRQADFGGDGDPTGSRPESSRFRASV